MNVQWSNSQGHLSLVPKILGILLLILALSMTNPVFAEENLIANPGFEEGSQSQDKEQIANWTAAGDVQWVTDEVHSGSRAVKLHADGGSSKIESSSFKVPVHARVEASAWLKAQDVVSSGSYFKLRMTLYAYKGDKRSKIKHWDLVSTVGSFEWKEVRASVIVPPESKYMRLAVQLTKSSGTVWVDDVVVKVAQVVPDAPAASSNIEIGEKGIGIETPTVIPSPLQMRASKETVPLGIIGILSNKADDILKEAIANYFEEEGIPFLFLAADEPRVGFTTILMLGDESQPAVNEQFQTLFEGHRWSDLGEQGYFLSIACPERCKRAEEEEQDQLMIYLGANSELGRFYGWQTMKQLLLQNNQNDKQQGKQIYVADIIDRPTLSRRGVPIGIQWYSQQPELFNRLAQLKLNFIWNQGAFHNEKFRYRWRESLTEREKGKLQQYLILARKHFVTPYIAIAPRGRDAAKATIYSSEREINLLVDKMTVLYDLGVRHFGLAFDDLGNSRQDVLVGDDVAFFNNDIGAAHHYFIAEVHKRLTARHSDINLIVVPMIYHDLGNRGDTELAYLATLAQLSPEIEIYSSAVYPEDAQLLQELTNRRPLIWDNFWATFYQKQPAPEFIVPLDRSASFDHALITGFTFLPLIPALEDASQLSWKTAADYAWAPERYDPEISFELASAQHLAQEPPEGEVIIETPNIAPSTGTFLDAVTVELTTSTADSTTRYTLDGSTPTESSPAYSEPFILTESTRVKAKAFGPRGHPASSDSGIASTFFAVYPVKSRVYLPIVQADPLDTGTNDSFFDDCLDQIGILFWLGIGALLLLMVISVVVWRIRRK